MKIAINTRFLLKDRLEGIGWYTYEIAKRLVLNHPEDQFYFLFDRPFDTKFIFASNVTPVVLRPPARHPVLFYIWFEFSVARFLKKNKIDLFFSPDGFLSLRTKVPSFLTIHDLAYRHYPNHVGWLMLKYYQHFMPKFVHKAYKVFTVSKYSKEDIITSFDLDSTKVTYFYNGCREIFRPIDLVDQELIRKELTGGIPYFIYIGSVHPRKNIERVIRAFDTFRKKYPKPYRLVLTGRMAWKSKTVSRLITNSSFQQDIISTGNIADKQLVKLLGGSSALIYPSLFEGFGIPILEAMHCQVPVITSNVSAMPEVGGNSVYYVNPISEEDLVEKMFEVVTNPKKNQQLIERSKQEILKFSWDTAAKGIYDTFREIDNVKPQ